MEKMAVMMKKVRHGIPGIYLPARPFISITHSDSTTMDTGDERMEEDPATKPVSVSLLPTLVAPLLALIQPTSLSFPPLAAPSPHPPTTSVLSAIHICALECLNNIFLSLAAGANTTLADDHDAGRKIWDGVWSALAAVGTETGLGQERRRDMWHVAVGVLWGIGSVWKGSLVSLFV